VKGTTVALDTLPDGREAAALIADGRLEDLLIDPPDDLPGTGALLRGRVGRAIKGMGGVFVDLPGGRSGYLRGAKGRRPGEALLVQVQGHAEPGKAVPVTDRLTLRSRHCVVTPGAPGLNVSRAVKDDAVRDRLLELAADAVPERDAHGLILRTGAAEAPEDEVADDVAATWALAMRVLADPGREPELLLDAPSAHLAAWRDWPADAQADEGAGAFDRHGAWAEVATLLTPALPLGSASRAHVEPTRALVAVDVDTAEGGLAAGLKANLALARALPRALRLRGLGGQITIDPAPMPRKERRAFEAALRAALRVDPVETILAGWTPLDHYELRRRRERRPLAELLPRGVPDGAA
jgi:Ribonuclease G/E